VVSFAIGPFLPLGRKSAVKIDCEVDLDPEMVRDKKGKVIAPSENRKNS
jgi:hypothetical protein